MGVKLSKLELRSFGVKCQSGVNGCGCKLLKVWLRDSVSNVKGGVELTNMVYNVKDRVEGCGRETAK